MFGQGLPRLFKIFPGYVVQQRQLLLFAYRRRETSGRRVLYSNFLNTGGGFYMKKRYYRLLAIFAGVLFLGLTVGQGLAENTDKGKSPDGLHRDGTAFIKERKISQTDRQAAADRAKAKGLKAPKKGKVAESDNTTPTDGGAKK
jgi:hypothetical protein